MRTFLFFLILPLLTLSKPGLAGDFYNRELNSVRDRQRIFVSTMENQLEAANRFTYWWQRIHQEGVALHAFLSAETNSEQGLITPVTMPHYRLLENLARKKVFLEVGSVRIKQIRGRVEQYLLNAESALSDGQFPADSAQAIGHAAARKAIVSELDRWAASYADSFDTASRNYEQTLSRIKTLEAQSQIDFRRRVASDLLYARTVSDVAALFNGVADLFQPQVVYRKDRDKAEEFLSAYTWFYEKAFPRLMAMADSDRKRQLYRELYERITVRLEKMNDDLKGLPAPLVPSYHFVQSSANDGGGGGSGVALPQIEPNVSESSGGTDRGIQIDGREYSGKDSSGSEPKQVIYVEAVRPEDFHNAQFIARDSDGEVIDHESLPSIPEFAGVISMGNASDSWEAFRDTKKNPSPAVASSGELGKVEPPQRYGGNSGAANVGINFEEMKKDTDRVQGMIKDARDRTQDQGRKQDLANLEKEYAKLETFQDAYNDRAKPQTKESVNAPYEADSKWKEVANSTPSPRIPEALAGETRSDEENHEELKAAAKMVADAALGIAGGLPYDAANFVKALTTDRDLFGSDVDTLGKSLMGAGVLLGLAMPLGSKGPALRAIGRAAQKEKWAKEVMAGLSKLADFAGDEVRDLVQRNPIIAKKIGKGFDNFLKSEGSVNGLPLGIDFALEHPANMKEFAQKGAELAQKFKNGEEAKVVMAMPTKHAETAVSQGFGLPSTIDYMNWRPGRAGAARSAGLDIATTTAEANRDGVQTGWKLVSANYNPGDLANVEIYPSVRNPGGIVIHHTKLTPDSLDWSFTDIRIIGDLNP